MTEPVRRSVRVRCDITHAFEVFTSRVDVWWPRGHRRFENSQMTLEALAGGRFVERSDQGEENKLGEVLACEPPHRISYTWYPGATDQPTHVDVRFVAEGEETIVHIVHSEGTSGLGETWPQRSERFQRGWDLILPAYATLASQRLTPRN